MKLGYIYGMKIRGDIKLGADPYSGDSSVIELGTWATPLLTAVATHVPISFVTTYIVAGDGVGGIFGVKGSITVGNLNLVGVYGRATVLTGKNIGNGRIDGVLAGVEVLGTGKAAGIVCGARVAVYVETNNAVIGSDVYGIFVSNYIMKQPAGSYGLLKLEEDGTVKVDAAIIVSIGTPNTTIDDFIEAGGPAGLTAFDAVGTKDNLAKGGFLRVKLWGMPGAGVRYIQLYGP
jgi:hypothetical protein